MICPNCGKYAVMKGWNEAGFTFWRCASCLLRFQTYGGRDSRKRLAEERLGFYTRRPEQKFIIEDRKTPRG